MLHDHVASGYSLYSMCYSWSVNIMMAAQSCTCMCARACPHSPHVHVLPDKLTSAEYLASIPVTQGSEVQMQELNA